MLNWKEIVQEYIIKYSNRIKKTTAPLRDHFAIAYFTYHRIDNAGKYTVLVDRPDWAEHYVSNQFYLNDPYLRHPSTYQSGMTIMENHGSEEYREGLLKSGKEVLNMDTGIYLIQKKEGVVEFFGFCATREASALENIYLNHPQLLQSFAAHFKKELKGVLNQMEDEAGSLIDLKGKDFASNHPIYPDIPSSTLFAYYRDLKRISDVERAQKLTLRERQCLKLLIENHSHKETAAALGLSSRTVEHYFENIKNKLSCSSKQELFQIAKTLEDIGLL